MRSWLVSSNYHRLHDQERDGNQLGAAMILDSQVQVLLCRHSLVLKPFQRYAIQCAMWGRVWFPRDITVICQLTRVTLAL